MDLFIDAKDQGELLCEKYGIPTYQEYKQACKTPDDILWKIEQLTPKERLIKSIAWCMTLHGQKPRALLINLKGARLLLDTEGEIPKEVESIPVVFDEGNIFPLGTYLL